MKIGIDLGGTKTEAILIDNDGKEIYRKRIITEKNYQGTLDGIKFLIDEIENKLEAVPTYDYELYEQKKVRMNLVNLNNEQRRKAI